MTRKKGNDAAILPGSHTAKRKRGEKRDEEEPPFQIGEQSRSDRWPEGKGEKKGRERKKEERGNPGIAYQSVALRVLGGEREKGRGRAAPDSPCRCNLPMAKEKRKEGEKQKTRK